MTEDAFLQALFARLTSPPGKLVIPPGDDCAGYALGGGKIFLVAVDQIVEKRHYLAAGPAAAKPEQVGRKLLARNLSDIAAMGGKPLFCLVAASLGPNHDERWLNRFFSGILKLGKKYGVSLIGGDLAAAPADTVAALTIIGEVDPDIVVEIAAPVTNQVVGDTLKVYASVTSGFRLTSVVARVGPQQVALDSIEVGKFSHRIAWVGVVDISVLHFGPYAVTVIATDSRDHRGLSSVSFQRDAKKDGGTGKSPGGNKQALPRVPPRIP